MDNFDCNKIYEIVGDTIENVIDKTMNSYIVPEEINGKRVFQIGGFAFSECINMKNISLPNSLYVLNSFAFKNCVSLTGMHIPCGVGVIFKDVFYGCSNLSQITVDKNNKKFSVKNQCLIDNNTKTLLLGCCGEIPEDVSVIGSGAFNYNGIKDVMIPESVISIEENAFENCRNIKYNSYDNGLYLGSFNNPYYALIKAKDDQITSCKVNDKTCIIADGAFDGCELLENISIPESVKHIGAGCFSGCYALKNKVVQIASEKLIR